MANKKTWSRMTRNERKVEICKDVLKQIDSERIRARTGVYLKTLGDTGKLCGAINSQRMREALDTVCEACAKGALMASRLLRSRKTVSIIDGASTDDAEKSLSDVFTIEELDEIECAFEGWSEEGLRLCRNHPVDEDRLIVIMQNIVDHKGEFMPEVKYEIYYK